LTEKKTQLREVTRTQRRLAR